MKSLLGRPIGNIRPTGNKILLKLDPRPAQTGLLHVPEAYQERQITGTVVSWGNRIHASVLAYLRAGMRIRLRNDICGIETWVGDVEHRLIQDGDLLAEIVDVSFCDGCEEDKENTTRRGGGYRLCPECVEKLGNQPVDSSDYQTSEVP